MASKHSQRGSRLSRGQDHSCLPTQAHLPAPSITQQQAQQQAQQRVHTGLICSLDAQLACIPRVRLCSVLAACNRAHCTHQSSNGAVPCVMVCARASRVPAAVQPRAGCLRAWAASRARALHPACAPGITSSLKTQAKSCQHGSTSCRTLAHPPCPLLEAPACLPACAKRAAAAVAAAAPPRRSTPCCLQPASPARRSCGCRRPPWVRGGGACHAAAAPTAAAPSSPQLRRWSWRRWQCGATGPRTPWRRGR